MNAALANMSVVIRATPASLNLFMNIPWTPDEPLAWGGPASKPGSYVVYSSRPARRTCCRSTARLRTREAHFLIE
jgi:hypothetical protein